MNIKLYNLATHPVLVVISVVLIMFTSGNINIPFRPALPESIEPIKPIQISDKSYASSGFTLAGPVAPPAPEEIVDFVKALHIHGISYEQARQFGPDAVPILLGLLADPENAPYKTNIVVTLGFIGDASVRQPLIDYLTQTEGEVSLSEFKGLSAVPFALAQLAHQGDEASLNFLIASSDQAYWNNQTLPWTYNGQSYYLDLYQNSLLALGVSGQPQAQARLSEITSQQGIGDLEQNDVLRQALELNQRVQNEGMAAAVNADPDPLPPAGEQNGLGSSTLDPNEDTRIHTFTVARHVNETGLKSNSQIDAILAKASEIMQTSDGPQDVGCCVILQRSGSMGTFSVTDGTISTSSELSAVGNVTSHHVKVVPSLDYCGGYNPSLLGCAGRRTKNFVVEFIDYKYPVLDAVLWAHEFGHNQDLDHASESNKIMSAGISFQNPPKQMTLIECTAWHSTAANPGTVAGPCPLIYTPQTPNNTPIKYYLPVVYLNKLPN